MVAKYHRCSNCGCDTARIKFIPRGSEAAELGKFVLAIFTACISDMFNRFKGNARWGNKLVCDSCGYEEWTKDSWLWNERA